MTRKTFSDSNQIILTDPINNTTVISELKNTLGRMDCISKDSNNCKLDNVFMTDNEDGNFGANFALPEAIAADTSSIVQQFTSMRFRGKSVIIVDGDSSLDDYF